MPLRYNVHSSSGNADTLATGSVIGGSAVNLGDHSRKKVENLSVLVTVDAETSTFTFAFKWQVSNDNSTWVDVANGTQNAAAVVLATGTGGADASVTKAFALPEGVSGWKYARAALVTGGTTGAAVDTYSFGYVYRAI